MIHRIQKLFVLVGSLAAGWIVGFQLAEAACIFKCDSVSYYTTKTALGDNGEGRTWYRILNGQKCIRIFNTSTHIDNFTNNIEVMREVKECNLSGCEVGCWANGNVWAAVEDCNSCESTGEAFMITCYEKCIMMPPM